MKKINFILSFLLFWAILTPSTYAEYFNDVDQTTWYYDELQLLSSNNVISGFPNGDFKPNDLVTRIQAAKIIYGAIYRTEESDFVPKFKDINPSHWGYPYVAGLAEKGIIANTDLFNPNQNLTRAQMAKLISEGFKLSETNSKTFTDVPQHTWYANFVNKLYVAGITTGKTATTFDPNGYVKRSELTAFIARALIYNSENLSPAKVDEWVGTWQRKDFSNNGTISIEQVKGNKVSIAIEVSSGGNTGSVVNNAYILGDTIRISEKYSSCVVTLTKSGAKITATQNEDCQFVGGLGTYFHGEYSLTDKPVETKYTLSGLGLVTKAEDTRIQKVVSSDYNTLVSNFDFINTNAHEKYGETRLKVIEGAVKGMYTFKEALIMSDETTYVYVGNIVYNANDEKFVRFYTNDPLYKSKVHPIFNKWRERFSSAPVEIVYVAN